MFGDLKGRRVLVTGITGFIGSALAMRLLGSDAHVVGISRTGFSSHVKIYRGDVSDADLVRSVVSGEEIDTVFHLAANAIVRTSAKDPVSSYATNIMGTVNVLEACRTVGGVKNITVASSDKAYGDHDDLPYTERHSLQPRNTYDTSKACMDLIARSYRHNYEMPVIVTRCSNVYGPGDMNFSRVIPNSIRRVVNGERPLVYGDVAGMEREFIYISDVIDAYMLLGFDKLPLSLEPAVNIGGAGPVSIESLVEMVAAETERQVKGSRDESQRPLLERVERDGRFKEIRRQFIDASYLESLGWKREVSLREGIKKTVEWYLDVMEELP